MSAPLSTRKGRFQREQKTESAPGTCGEAEEREEIVILAPGVTDDSRLWSFPELKEWRTTEQPGEEVEFDQA